MQGGGGHPVATQEWGVSKACDFRRDTYSDRSGSSSPDSEITELKFPPTNHD